MAFCYYTLLLNVCLLMDGNITGKKKKLKRQGNMGEIMLNEHKNIVSIETHAKIP